MNGFVEAVLVTFDTSRISYDQLLDVYWHHTDPTDPSGAFVDRGPQYRPVVFYMDDAQKAAAEASKAALDASKVFGKPIAAQISAAPKFWPAEAYHQKFWITNAAYYENYRIHSGRDQFFAKVWGKSALLDPGAPPSIGKRLHEAHEDRAAEDPDRNAVRGHPAGWHRAALPQRVLQRPPRGHLRRRGLRRASLQFARQVRVRHGLAELHAAPRSDQRAREDRHQPGHGARRGTQPLRGLAPGPRLRRRPRADGPALLHGLRGASVRAGDGHGEDGLRSLHEVLQ